MEKSKIQLAKEKAASLLKFFTEKSTEQTTEKFEAVQIKDKEDKLEYAELAEGASVSISTSTGSEPAPDGKYSLVNDVVVTVEAGVIKSFTKPEEKVEEEKVELEEEVVEEKAPADDTAVKALEEKVTNLEEMVKALYEIIEGAPSKDEVAEFNSKVEKLSKVPTQMSADNRVEIQETQLDKARKLAEKFTKK